MPDFKYMLQGKYAEAFKEIPQLRTLLVSLYFAVGGIAAKKGLEIEDMTIIGARMENTRTAVFHVVPKKTISKILGPDGRPTYA